MGSVTNVPSIMAVGRIVDGDAPMHVASPVPSLAADADLDALIDEVFGKPGLGVEDSAGLIDMVDYDAEAENIADRDLRAWGMR